METLLFFLLAWITSYFIPRPYAVYAVALSLDKDDVDDDQPSQVNGTQWRSAEEGALNLASNHEEDEMFK